jgi:myosin heavy subunit
VLERDGYKNKALNISRNYHALIAVQDKILSKEKKMYETLLAEKMELKKTLLAEQVSNKEQATKLASKDATIKSLQETSDRLRQELRQNNTRASGNPTTIMSQEEQLQEEIRETQELDDVQEVLPNSGKDFAEQACPRERSSQERPPNMKNLAEQFKALGQVAGCLAAGCSDANCQVAHLSNPGAPKEITVENEKYELIAEGKQNAGYYKQKRFKISSYNGKVYKSKSYLMPLVLQVPGDFTGESVSIDGKIYDRYIEKREEKFVTKPTAHYIVKDEGQCYAKWTIARVIEVNTDDSP